MKRVKPDMCISFWISEPAGVQIWHYQMRSSHLIYIPVKHGCDKKLQSTSSLNNFLFYLYDIFKGVHIFAYWYTKIETWPMNDIPYKCFQVSPYVINIKLNNHIILHISYSRSTWKHTPLDPAELWSCLSPLLILLVLIL